MHLRILLSFLLTLLIGSWGFGQDEIKDRWKAFKVYGKFNIYDGGRAYSRITLMQNDEIIVENIPHKGGKFEYELEFDYDYVLIFSKRGYVSKKVYVSTYVPADVIKIDNRFPALKFDITLYPKVAGIDYSLFEDPISAILYDKSIDDFDYDKEYNEEMEARVNEIESQVREKLKSNTDIDIIEKEPEIETVEREKALDIISSDNVLNDNSIETGEKQGELVLSETPPVREVDIDITSSDNVLSENTIKTVEKQGEIVLSDKPPERIIDATDLATSDISSVDIIKNEPIEKIVEKKKVYILPINKVKKEEEKNYIIEFPKSDKDDEYNKLIDIADSYFEKKEYPFAKHYYKLAFGIRQYEIYPYNQLLEIERYYKLLGDNITENRYINQKSSTDDIEKKYKAFIDKAKESIKTKNFLSAKSYYMKALSLNFDNDYALSKINEMDALFKRTKDRASENEFIDYLKKGKTAFDKKDFAIATFYIKKALAMNFDNKVALSQLNNVEDAQAYYKKEKQINEFEAMVEKANTAAQSKKYNLAMKYYHQALEINPNAKFLLKNLIELYRLQ